MYNPKPRLPHILLLLSAILASLTPGRLRAANDTWTGGGAPNGRWQTGANWGGTAPSPGDALFFDTSTQTATTNNFTAGALFAGITFNNTAGAFTLNGSNVFLSSVASANVVGVLNNSSFAQTLGLPLTLDWGYTPFGSPGGGTLALNGPLTLNTGSAAYFDSSVSSSFLTNDSSGLIAAAGGAGLIYSDGNIAFTGLAAMSGSAIGAYSGWPSVVNASGTIGATTPGAAVNIEITPSGAGNYPLANGTGITYANTIFLSTASAGPLVLASAGGAQTLDLGAVSGIGGIYVPDGATAQAVTVGSGASTILTAGAETGPATPGTIVFAVNGTSTGNQIENNSTITDNASGGSVTVVKTGTGSMYTGATLTNTYSGGTYVLQGQLQGNNTNSFAKGPVYIATNATVLLNAGSLWANNFFLSPGSGAPITGGTAATGAGSLEINNGETFSGMLNLMGSAVTVPPGDRITGNDTGGTFTFAGQITGTGTLEFFGYHTYTAVLQNTSLVNTNNWQGGLIIGGKPGVAVNVDVKMGSSNQIPSGASAGNVTFIPATAAVYSRFDLNSFNQTINGLIGTNANSQEVASTAGAQVQNFGSTSCILTLGANNATATFNGLVADGGSAAKGISLNKIGTGTQTFGSAVNHFGTTTVSAGTFALNGSATMSNTPSINIAAGATFDASSLGNFTVAPNQSFNCIGGINNVLYINGALSPFMTTIGTINIGDAVTFDSGSTYVWDINNAAGTAGTDSGWGLLNVTNGASLTVNTPMTVKIVSLAAGDVPGNAAGFNPNANTSWTIMHCASGITVNPASIIINASSFSNAVGNGSFSVALSGDGNSLLLKFNSTPAITTQLANVITNAGGTAVFTVVATNAANPLAYLWVDPNNSPLFDGETTSSGATVTIITNVAAHSSTLTLVGVEDSDAGLYGVTVTNSVGQSGVSSATLTVIDAPSGPTVAETGADTIEKGGITYYTVTTAGGTPPFTYQWFFNGAAISGATNAILPVNVTPTNEGSYYVVVSNPAGSVTNSPPEVIGPMTSVPNQVIYDPFSSYVPQSFPPGGPDTWEGVTNLFNQTTGKPAWWFHSSGSGVEMIVQLNDIGNGVNNANGGSYPWPGLAGNSANCIYWSESLNSHLEFQPPALATGTTMYVSFILSCVSLGSANGVTDVLAGFVNPSDGTAFNLKLCSQISNFGAGQYQLGVGKGNGQVGGQVVDANTVWADPILTQQAVFVVLAYTVVSGGSVTNDDTVSMWLNPDASTFYAGSPPPPTLGPTNFGVVNSSFRDFGVHSTAAPASHRIADVRIGTTWASVTPPSAPTLTLANVTAYPGATATFASQNAGNPVTTYSWQFDNGSPLTDNSHYSGSSTATLVISNVGPADVGTYTVTGINTDPITLNNLTNTASATLTIAGPPLYISRSAPNATIAWPTNAAGFTLENTSGLSPASWTTNSSPPYPVVGTNYSVTVTAGPHTKLFRLIH